MSAPDPAIVEWLYEIGYPWDFAGKPFLAKHPLPVRYQLELARYSWAVLSEMDGEPPAESPWLWYQDMKLEAGW